MANQRKKYPKALRCETLPHWTLEQLDELDAWLMTVQRGAMQAKATLRAQQPFDEHGWTIEGEVYWKNATSTLKWVRGMLKKRRTALQKQREQQTNGRSGPGGDGQ